MLAKASEAKSRHVVYAAGTLLLEPAPSSNVILTLALTVAAVGVAESVMTTVTVWTPEGIALTPAAVALNVSRPVVEEIDRPAVVTAGKNS